MTLKCFAALFGLVFVVVGILGFVPALTPNGLLLNVFMVDNLHNIVHLGTGIIALLAATKEHLSRLFFQVFGIIYAVVAILGFFLKGNMMLMQMNAADNWLHLGIAIVALLLGFCCRPRVTA